MWFLFVILNINRLEWESAVLRGSRTFQGLEEERLNNLKSILTAYFKHSSEMCPKLLEVNWYIYIIKQTDI